MARHHFSFWLAHR